MDFKTFVILTCIGSVYMQADQAELDKVVARCKDAAQTINIVNGPLIIIGQGPFPQILRNIQEICNILNTNTASETGSKLNLTKIDDFCKILIGKAGLFHTIPLIGSPVETALRQLESCVEANSHKHDQQGTKHVKILLGRIRTGIQAYGGLINL